MENTIILLRLLGLDKLEGYYHCKLFFVVLIPFNNIIMIRIILIIFLYVINGINGKLNLPEREKTNIALIGDSNSFRLTVGFEDNLRCTTTGNEQQAEGRLPRLEYWSRDGQITGVNIHSRDCGGCNSRRADCANKVSHIEYITMEYVMDTEVSTLRTYWDKTCTAMTTGLLERDVECYQSITTQEFLFGEYWNKNEGTCPDIISHINTAVHDISRFTTDIYRRNVRWFFEVVKYFLDVYCPNTIYLYSTAGRVNENHVPDIFKSLTTNAHITEFNNIALEIFNTMNHERMIFAFDVNAITTAYPDSDYLDAVHLQKHRYNEMAIHFLNEMSLL